ncbi:Alcohol dehydrogenase [Wickerhamomyces ciferrii]|uniref:alcohol dehydrogenase n=1 Tax=Wickerhamomyces ciferrii (strain ATCC 14091 / BCRC 22168 / CBS 111 / JCM 3599 / NBRC 0793 / NRRL Y-1031 F-60-10) TaxID=1206466 RepID=K0KE20_WICCF|nr:Alcohol dehydrogenase [Wickerhamomyces ciferrii]CCH43340.1 Alcohol dehydrogenase [Wickerhamomyces ciferrii]
MFKLAIRSTRLAPRSTYIFRSLATASSTSPNIPATQKAIVFDQHGGPLQYKDIQVPKPGPNDILVNIKYTGVCNSDYHIWKGDWAIKPQLPLILGHEGAGVVVAKGENVSNFQIGDHAGIKWVNSTCQSCEFCQESHESSCPSQTNSGFSVQGTYQQYCLANADQAAHIPKDVDLAKAAPLLCAGLTVYKALRNANIRAGQTVAIIGAGGGLGSLAVQYGVAMGYRVIGIDASNKKEHVLSKGADAFVDFSSKVGVPEQVLELTEGKGPHAVINVSNSVQAYNEAITYVRPTGTVILVGLPQGGAKLESDIVMQTLRAVNIKGSVVGNRADTREALEFFRRGKVDSPVKIVGLSEAPDVFKLMEDRKIMGRYVLDTSK